jgi:hypothetical protein
MTLVCNYCGRDYEVPACHFHRRLHCSRACFAANTVANGSRKGARNGRWKEGRIIRDDGYVLLYAPAHPRAVNGYVLEHILIAERWLGKALPPHAVIHHSNGNRSDNRPENLVICPDQAAHARLHGNRRHPTTGRFLAASQRNIPTELGVKRTA